MSQPTLDFKYLRNIMMYIGEEPLSAIPMQMKEVQNPMGVTDRQTGKGCIVPVFEMEKVHKIALEDEELELPDRADFASDRDFEEEMTVVYNERRAARTKNDALRRKIYHYVTRGNIEIVNDPFAKRKIKSAPGGAQRPSEIAKEMDATANNIAARPAPKAPPLKK